jgi:hypothetical protein
MPIEKTRFRVLGIAVAALFSAVTLTGCTAPTDPFVEDVKASAVDAGFTDSGQMASGCIGMYLICAQPMYEPVFYMPESVGAETACAALFETANKLGAVGYSVFGSPAAKLQGAESDAAKLCTDGLGIPLINTDGSEFYQGINLYDDGAADSFGKVYAFNRGDSEFGKAFTLIISFSKDLGRTGPVPFGSEKPKLLTQEDLDVASGLDKTVAETMKFANPLLGQSEQLAISKIEAAGYRWVVIARDQEEFVYDQQYDPRRIRLTIKEGIVYDAIAG